MKKLCLFLIVLLMTFQSCEKSENIILPSVQEQDNIVYPIILETKLDFGSTYQLQFMCGHSAEGCNGCVNFNGRMIHVDCQGRGNTCTASAIIGISPGLLNNTFTATTQDSTDLTNEAFFMMPDRSLYAGKDEKGNDLWLNIPEQLSLRDSCTRQFSFTGLTYTNYALYENE